MSAGPYCPSCGLNCGIHEPECEFIKDLSSGHTKSKMMPRMEVQMADARESRETKMSQAQERVIAKRAARRAGTFLAERFGPGFEVEVADGRVGLTAASLRRLVEAVRAMDDEEAREFERALQGVMGE